MIIEFLIAYRKEAYTNIESVLIESLTKVLEDNLNDFEPEVLKEMIQLRHERVGHEHTDEIGIISKHVLLGFALDLPDEVLQIHTVIEEFAAALSETPPIFHAVKFEDPLLRADLANYAEHIFGLEMKLRRVLTLIYLHANQNPEDAYNLLRDESVQPMAKEKVKVEQMHAVAENQFFHLTFGQYIGLNERPEFKLPTLLSVIRDAETYDAFRTELDRSPIRHEDDAVLMAGLKERMDAIEAMRNCCAHNRRPSKKIEENYLNARPLLEQLLDEYLERWEYQEPSEEPFWRQHAREAVEALMEGAEWNDEEDSITLFDDDENTTVHNREELEDKLRNIAEREFYGSVPRADNDYIERCDEYGIVESILFNYDQRLAEFFRHDNLPDENPGPS